MISSFTLKKEWEAQMRRSRFLQAGILSFCLIVGHVMLGCGDEGEVVTIDLCALALEDMNSQNCRQTAYARVDDLKDCVMGCGPADDECLEDCLNASGSAFSECTGEIQFLFSGACGECPVGCAFDFVGDETVPGCLMMDPLPTAEQCLDAFYDCVNDC